MVRHAARSPALRFLALTLATLLATPALAAGDPIAGAQKAATCTACHNPAAAAPAIPALSGQRDQFLQWQLVFFRSARRNNPVMTPMAQQLSDEDVRDLGAYFGSLPAFVPASADANPALHDAGAAIAQSHRCAACHQDDFTGKQAAARIAGQNEAYLVHALSDYRSGARPSTGVAAMTEAAAGLSDDDIAALAHYLATYR